MNFVAKIKSILVIILDCSFRRIPVYSECFSSRPLIASSYYVIKSRCYQETQVLAFADLKASIMKCACREPRFTSFKPDELSDAIARAIHKLMKDWIHYVRKLLSDLL